MNLLRCFILWLFSFPYGIWRILNRVNNFFIILVSFSRCSVRLSWVNSRILWRQWLHTNIIAVSCLRYLPLYVQLLSAITRYICNHSHSLGILCWLVETHLGFLVVESPIIQGAGSIIINKCGRQRSRRIFLQKSRMWIIKALEESQY